jgi:glycosyltransferase involved in cell wall biosynthesis
VQTQQTEVTIFSPTFSDGGGVSRVFVNLANGMAELGHRVALIVNRSGGTFLDQLNPRVELLLFKGRKTRELVGELLDYLLTRPPQVVLSGQPRDDEIMVKVRRKLRSPSVRFFVSVGTSIPEQARLNRRLRLGFALFRRRFRKTLSAFDGIIIYSNGAAEELSDFLGIPRERIFVAPLPTVTPDLTRLAEEPADHSWLTHKDLPVVISVGRLARVKDFPTLLRAFDQLLDRRPCRLLIVGRGRQERRIRALISELKLSQDVDMVGFVDNPYAYIARADLLVVSSLREGGPQVLIEAMAAGTPVVSTDCPNGPREILEFGRYGPLVPRRDPLSLSIAMARTLDDPPPADLLRKGAQRYSLEHSSRIHLEILGLARPGLPTSSK